MQQKKPEYPPVKIAVVVGVVVLLIALTLAVFAKEYLLMVGWILIPLTMTGVGLAMVTAKGKR